ncbi:hypothetical protein XENOCAPTIV_025914, partial [Xenoophorus captivus]
FSGAEEEKIKQAVGTFCSNQPFALEIIKNKQKKDSRFTSFIQRLEDYQRRLDLSSLKQTDNPMILELK